MLSGGNYITKNNSPFPSGYKFKTGSLVSSSSATISVPANNIPLTLRLVASGSGSWSDPWINVIDNNSTKVFALSPGKNNEVNFSINTPIDLMSYYNWDFDRLATVNKFTVSNNKSSWTISVIAWLEKE